MSTRISHKTKRPRKPELPRSGVSSLVEDDRFLSALLFKVNLCALLLKFSLDLLSLSFGSALFNYLRSVVYEIFSFFQSKTCNLTYNLDYFNLGSTCRYKLLHQTHLSPQLLQLRLRLLLQLQRLLLQIRRTLLHKLLPSSFNSNTDNSLIASIISAVVILAIFKSSIFIHTLIFRALPVLFIFIRRIYRRARRTDYSAGVSAASAAGASAVSAASAAGASAAGAASAVSPSFSAICLITRAKFAIG